MSLSYCTRMVFAAVVCYTLLTATRAKVVTLTVDQRVSVNRCQANCLKRFSTSQPSDEHCSSEPNCDMCWKVCEKLRTDASSWKYVCEAHDTFICPVGCVAACRFDSSKTTADIDTRLTWSFTRQPEFKAIGHMRLTLDWHKPRPLKGAILSKYVVYTLFWRDEDNKNWNYLCTSASLHARMDGPHYLYKRMQFRLLAVSEHGLMAVVLPAYPPAGYTPPEDDVADYDDYGNSYDDDYPSEEVPPPSPVAPASARRHGQPESYAAIQVGLDVSLAESGQGGIRARITWHQQAPPRPSTYLVRWGRISCRFDPAFVGCDTPREEYAASVQAARQTSMQFTAAVLTYNSQYWVEIEVYNARTQRLYFYTPGCRRPDVTFTSCRHDDTTSSVTPAAAPSADTRSGPSRQPALNWTFYVTLAVGAVVAAVAVAFVVVVVRNHAQLRRLVVAKATLVRTRTSSLRGSLRSSRSSFRHHSLKGSTGSSRTGGAASLCELPSTQSPLASLAVSTPINSHCAYPSSVCVAVSPIQPTARRHLPLGASVQRSLPLLASEPAPGCRSRLSSAASDGVVEGGPRPGRTVRLGSAASDGVVEAGPKPGRAARLSSAASDGVVEGGSRPGRTARLGSAASDGVVEGGPRPGRATRLGSAASDGVVEAGPRPGRTARLGSTASDGVFEGGPRPGRTARLGSASTDV